MGAAVVWFGVCGYSVLSRGAAQVTRKGPPERVIAPYHGCAHDGAKHCTLVESACLGMHAKVRGTSLVRLNTAARPIANKYCEGKLKTTAKAESKEMKPGGGNRRALASASCVIKCLRGEGVCVRVRFGVLERGRPLVALALHSRAFASGTMGFGSDRSPAGR